MSSRVGGGCRCIVCIRSQLQPETLQQVVVVPADNLLPLHLHRCGWCAAVGGHQPTLRAHLASITGPVWLQLRLLSERPVWLQALGALCALHSSTECSVCSQQIILKSRERIFHLSYSAPSAQTVLCLGRLLRCMFSLVSAALRGSCRTSRNVCVWALCRMLRRLLRA